MKFITFLKIFGLAVAGFIGALGVGVGVMAIAGTFNDPVIQPENIAFVRPAVSEDGQDVSVEEYKVDDNFTAKIVTATTDVTETKITLSFPNSSDVTEKDGKISDGVVIVPKVVEIGKVFTIELVKIQNDSECGGKEWIAGGHSILRATSINPKAESVRIPIHVDVPVYDVELQAEAGGVVSDTFVLDTDFNASLKFYPARSAYQYSFDGSEDGNGGHYEIIKKNAYYMLTSGNDQYISQVNFSNTFHAKAVGANSRIDGYIFSRTILDERMLDTVSSLSGQEKHNAILQNMRNIVNTQSLTDQVFFKSTNVNIVDIDVDQISATGDVPDVAIDTRYTLYANNAQLIGKNDIDLGLRLLSNYNETANLQAKLKNVGITFLYRQGNNYFSAFNNENSFYNVIQMPQDGYEQTKVVVENGVSYTYFFPVITSNISNYHWDFALSRYCDTDSIYIQIQYFDGDREVQSVRKSFATKIVVANQITWNDLSDVSLKIVDGENPVYKFYDIKSRANVPQANLYQTKKYFAFSDTNDVLTNFIHAEEGVVYTLGSQTFTLYELPDGIIQAKNVDAHGLAFNVIFVTIKTDYNGNEVLEDNKYVINQYSQDVFGAVSGVVVNVNKTLLGLNHNLVTSGDEDDLIRFDGDEENTDALAYVHTFVAPFDIVISCKKISEEQGVVEEGIFRQAIIDGKIQVIAKVNGVVTDIIYLTNITEEKVGDDLTFRFSMSIKELPAGTTDIKVTLYVVYDKGEAEPDVFKVATYNEEGKLSFIEVYNGAAETFAFNLNICSGRQQQEVDPEEPGGDEPGDEPGENPDNPGENPDEPGENPDQPGTGEPGDNPDESGDDNNNNNNDNGNDPDLNNEPTEQQDATDEPGKYKTSADRRVVVETVIESTSTQGEDEVEHSIVTNITTKFLLDGEDISDLLFVTKDGNVEIGNPYIVLKDKHGKMPLSALYVLESTNTSILVVTENNTLVFTGTGNVELKLIHKNNGGVDEVKDILYFTCVSEGRVTKVEKLALTQDGTSFQKRDEYVYDPTLDNVKDYDFGTLTIPVYGYAGLSISLNNTDDNAYNLISYYYSYEQITNANLVNKMIFTLVNSDDLQLEESGHIIFVKDESANTLTNIRFEKDFGVRRTIQIHVAVPDLGISQVVELDVRPNISITAATAENNLVVDAPKGSNIYNGVPLTAIYSDALYMVDVSLQYVVWSSTVNDYYFFEVYDVVNGERERMKEDSNTYARIVRIERTNGTTTKAFEGDQINDALKISRNLNDTEGIITYRFYFAFFSQQTDSKVLILSLRRETLSTVDVQKDIYLNVNQNVKVTVDEDDNSLYLITLNENSLYGELELYSCENAPITVSRIKNNSDGIDDSIKELNKTVSVVIDEEASGSVANSFYMQGYKLVSKDPITDQKKLIINVLYNDVVIRQLTFFVKPNIIIDNDEGRWVVYGENSNDYYLKLINGKRYKEADLIAAFSNVHDELPSGCEMSIIIDYSNDLIKPYIGYDPIEKEYIANGSSSNLVYKKDLIGYAVLNNARAGEVGDKVTFRIMILPTDLPFMIYRDSAGNIIDTKDENLYDLLDVEYLRNNMDKYCYVAKKAGDQENILFSIREDGLYGYECKDQFELATITEDQFVQGTHYIKVEDDYVLADEYDVGETYYIKVEGGVSLVDTDKPVGLQFVDTNNSYYSIQNLNADDPTDYAYITLVTDSDDQTKKTGMLKAQQVGKDVYVVLYCTLDNYTIESLIIPYIIKIPKELEIKTYYPYMQGASENDYGINEEELVLNNPSFDMEYLSFQDGRAELNMLERFNQEIPNQKYSYRYAIGKYVDGVFTKVDKLSALSELTFEVGELWYYAPGGWLPADNIEYYASISSNIDGNGLLTVLQRGGITKVRLRIDITTRSGIYASYYVSVGEVPTFYLTDENGTKASDTLNVTANTTKLLVGLDEPRTYRLSKQLNNTVTDATDLIRFYSYDDSEYKTEPNVTIDNVAMTMQISESTRNWQTQLFVYTIYGLVQVVTVNITSDYTIIYQENEIIVNNELEQVYEVVSGSIVDFGEYFKLKQNQSSEGEYVDIDNYIITFNNDNYPQIYVDSEDNSKVIFGNVKDYTRIDFSMEYVFDGDKVYNFIVKVRVKPFVYVGYYNGLEISQLNMYGGITDMEANNKDGTPYPILDSLFRFANVDYKTWLDNFEQDNGYPAIEFKLLTTTLNDENFTAEFDEDYRIVLKTGLVAIQTIVSFRVSLVNKLADGSKVTLLSSYFTFTIAPTFRIEINYPTPNDTAVVAAEAFYYNPLNAGVINLNEKAIFEEKDRVRILGIDGEELSPDSDEYDNIFVVTDYTILSCNSIDARGYVPIENASFSINDFAETSKSVALNIVYLDSTDGAEAIPVSLGTYNLVIDKSMGVFTAKGTNFNGASSVDTTNKVGNPENIYIGTNDNVMYKVYVDIAIPSDAIITSNKYIAISQIGGQSVAEQVEVSFGQGSAGQTLTAAVYLTQSTFMHSGMNDNDYKIYDRDTGTQIDLKNARDEIVKPTFSFRSRIKLTYRTYVTTDGVNLQTSSEVVDFFKMYKVLDIDSLNVNDSAIESEELFTQEIILKALNNTKLGEYLVNYRFDVAFETTHVELEAGESTTILKDSPRNTRDYYYSLLNIKRISSSYYYVDGDFGSENGLNIVSVSIDEQYYTSDENKDNRDELCENLGYLLMSPVTNDNSKNLDYIFLAMGAPDFDSITTKVRITIGYKNAKKDFVITFVVSNDYQNEYLRNQDGSLNNQIARSRLAAGLTYTLAITNSTEMIQNFVYIKHGNPTEDIYVGNVASFFTPIIENAGNSYANIVYGSNGELQLRIDEVMFGNANLDIVFRDSYGYEFTYYVTVIAKYNPVYQQGDVTIFELDTVGVVKYGTTTDANVLLPITIEKREAEYAEIDNQVSISLEFTKNKSATPIQNTFTELTTNKYKVNYINQDEFLVSGSEEDGDAVYQEYLDGIISIRLTYSGSTNPVVIKVNTRLREKYSIRSTANPYVRDGVQFSILDIIDVYDNKQEVAIGERSLTNVQAIYFEYELKEGTSDVTNTMLLDESNNFSNNITIGIKATNKNTGVEVYRPITNKSGSYITIQDLFEDIDSIQNYKFSFYKFTDESIESINDSGTWSQAILTERDYNDDSKTTWLDSTTGIDGGVLKPYIGFQVRVNGELKYYYFRIKKACIVEDQIFSIALRPLTENTKIDVTLYNNTFGSTKTFSVYADSNTENKAVQTYSLRTLGFANNDYTIDYSLYTNQARTIIRGLSNTDLLRLKGAKFYGKNNYTGTEAEKYANLDKIVNNTAIKYIEYNEEDTEDNIFTLSDDGILYNAGTLRINVEYAFVNNAPIKHKYNFAADVKVTLKFIAIDTRYAYGSDIARKIEYQTEPGSEYTINNVNGTELGLDRWAGNTKRPIYVVAGYTDATSFANEESTTLYGNGGDFTFDINTSVSGSSGLYEIDNENDDHKITLHQGFNLEQNYIALNVNVKYGDPEKHVDDLRAKQIGTVLLRFRNITTNTLYFNLKSNKLLENTDAGSYVRAEDVAKILTVSDNSDSTWTGEDIIRSFGSRIEFAILTTQLSLEDAQFVNLKENSTFGFSRAEGERYVTLAVKGKDDPKSKAKTYAIQLVDKLYEAGCLLAENEYSLDCNDGEVVNKLLKLVKFKNIYNESMRLNDLTEAGIISKPITLEPNDLNDLNMSKKNAEKVIKVSFGYGSGGSITTEFGSVYVRLYKKADQISMLIGSISLEREQSSDTIPSDIWYNIDETSVDVTIGTPSSYNIYIGGSLNKLTITFNPPTGKQISGFGDISYTDKDLQSRTVQYVPNGATIVISNTSGQLENIDNSVSAALRINYDDSTYEDIALRLYKDLYDYLEVKYGVDKTTLKTRLIAVDNDTANNFSKYVTYNGLGIEYHDLDKIDSSDFADNTVKFKIVVYYTYTDDCPDGTESNAIITSTQKVVDLFAVTYSLYLKVEEEPEG